MSTETKPVITSLTRTTGTPEPLQETKPVVLRTVSQAASIPELITYLKSSYRDEDFSRVEEILTGREKQLRAEIRKLKEERNSAEKGKALAILEKLKIEEQFDELKKKIEELETEKAEAEAKLKVYDLKFKEFDSRMSRVEEEIGKTHGMDVSVIQKMVEDFEEENDEVVEVNSTGKEDPLPANFACENRAPVISLSASEKGDCIKNNLHTACGSGTPGSSNVIHITESDDEMGGKEKASVSNGYGAGKNLTFQESSASLSKRKRDLSETDNDDGSSFGRQKTGSTLELDGDEKLQSLPPDPKAEFIRQCDDKVGGKWHSQLSPRRADSYKLGITDESSTDSDDDPCSDKNMNMLIKRMAEARKFSSEDGLRASFEKDPALCMSAVCALYRHQIEGLSLTKSQGLSHSDKFRITALGEYLIDGDPKNKLRKAVAEVRPKDHEECKRLATKYCHELYEIYCSREDHLFRYGAFIH